MVAPAHRPATYADLEAVPEHLVAEIIDGVLETRKPQHPRDGAATASLVGQLGSSLDRGGRRNWILMFQPELHLGAQVVVPVLAGWRRAHMAGQPEAAFTRTPPNWICELPSSATARLVRGPKRRIYAEAGVEHLWQLDSAAGLLESFTLKEGAWRLEGIVRRGETVAMSPFEAAPFPLDDLFPFDNPAAPAQPET
ncbi:Uma2 family endonuclease [Methylobacterium radiodurans]|uniref:Putative restriction endonuclease domain-containing protein n=1 Tax=Methylobacterium radiodurans TaxID=2202828 RepID=A0A2U8VRM6_9HYPH|nr:Uma2 family endonuclease [Methylobacterium radiodurans]AWN36429.1 hypothetical protein DK427_12400 [Methylobacterium radiodurans]